MLRETTKIKTSKTESDFKEQFENDNRENQEYEKKRDYTKCKILGKKEVKYSDFR